MQAVLWLGHVCKKGVGLAQDTRKAVQELCGGSAALWGIRHGGAEACAAAKTPVCDARVPSVRQGPI